MVFVLFEDVIAGKSWTRGAIERRGEGLWIVWESRVLKTCVVDGVSDCVKVE